MKKRYIDFVPVAKEKSSVSATSGAVKTTPKAAKTTSKTATKKPVAKAKITRKDAPEVSIEDLFVERTQPAGVSKGLKTQKELNFGVIEDYHPDTVNKGVSKKAAPQKEALSREIAKKPINKPYVRPATHFVNTEKIEKRPLSKSVATKKPVVLPKKEISDPARIIAKPEKDSKAGLIIAVILTIILGAAAGTVAFLLLPK